MVRLFRTYLLLFCTLFAIPLSGQQQGAFQPEWLPEGQGIRSGYLQVPENHDDPEGRSIRIAYIVLPAANSPSDHPPLIYFSGGPGGNTLGPGIVGYLMGHPFREARDIVLFDQRGIGYSSALPDMSFASFDILAADAGAEEEIRLTRQMLDDYRQKCEALGIQTEFYNSVQNARDVGMLFEHLGYDKYVLFGGSYGTRLARVVQDLFPHFVHCSVLDSPSPLTGDFLLNRLESYSLALGRIFAHCEEDESCKTEYPHLEQEYFQAIESLKKQPLAVMLQDTIPFVVNPQDGIYLLRRLLYQDNSREKAPEMIRAFREGNPAPVETVLGFEYQLTGGLNLTMLLSVEKFENFNPANSDAVIREHYLKYPLIPAELGFFDAFYRAGMDWHQGHMPMEDRHFEDSDVPSLIFVNRFDPVTPPKNGHLFMERLSRGTLLILDEGGHGGGNQECKEQVIIAFMENPDNPPDTGCLNLYTE